MEYCNRQGTGRGGVMKTVETLLKRLKTVLAEVLASLLDGVTLMQIDALCTYLRMRLAHRIYVLKHDTPQYIAPLHLTLFCGLYFSCTLKVIKSWKNRAKSNKKAVS